MRFVLPLAGISFVALFSTASAAELYSDPPHGVAKHTSQAPVIDGALDTKEWAQAMPLLFPASTAETKEKPPCEVRFLWSEKGVYVSFRTIDATPAYGHFKPGEPLFQEDSFEIFIDQAGDHRQYYEIQMNPAGQTFFKNYVLTAPPRLTAEKRLTPEFGDSELWRYELPTPEGFQVSSKLNPQTHVWTLEAFLPASFANRRHDGKDMTPCTWRINLVRHDWDLPKDAPDRKVQFMYWAPVLPGHPHLSPEAMGYLELQK